MFPPLLDVWALRVKAVSRLLGLARRALTRPLNPTFLYKVEIPRKITVLCVGPKSVYWGMPGVECYDRRLEARTWPGGTPLIAHPPCRAWSRPFRHKAKPEPGEKDLGLWCARQVIAWGGILEQPAGSLLWHAAGLPAPGTSRGNLLATCVDQAWWGFPTRKRTWLLLAGIDASELLVPLVLRHSAGDRQRFDRMSKHQRSATCRPFAEWLVSAARSVRL